MKKVLPKLLLNAEPFGFGPTAAIATFFPTLRDNFETVGFAGKGHTLDLQQSLAYDTVHDISDLEDTAIVEILQQYDVVCTALDFGFAELAIQNGVRTIIYDPLTWYWEHIPAVLTDTDVYLAQDFYNVKERIEAKRDLFPVNTHVVSPIVSSKRDRGAGAHVLLNLGGLQNPFWSEAVVVSYAQCIISSVLAAVPDMEVVIAGSQMIAKQLPQYNIKSFPREIMHQNLLNATYAFMTPGLGNIYDAAKFNLPTVWLPPANDSQGQQLMLLKKHNAIDGCIDWSVFGQKIEYFSDQQTVLRDIQKAVDQVDVAVLQQEVRSSIDAVRNKTNSATSAVLDTFGTGGAEEVCAHIITCARTI